MVQKSIILGTYFDIYVFIAGRLHFQKIWLPSGNCLISSQWHFIRTHEKSRNVLLFVTFLADFFLDATLLMVTEFLAICTSVSFCLCLNVQGFFSLFLPSCPNEYSQYSYLCRTLRMCLFPMNLSTFSVQ